MIFCVYTVIKNERPHLDEWIQYHLNLGVDKIILIEDRESDSHQDIADKYGVELYHIENILSEEEYISTYRQRYVINWFINSYGKEHHIDWGILLDCDEFLVFDIPIHDFFKIFEDVPAIHLYWKCYNANGHYKIDPGTQQELYKSDSAIIITKKRLSTKYIINLDKCDLGKMENIHYYINGVITNGEPINPKSNQYVYDYAYIDHFICRSYEDWVYKLRNRRNLNSKKDDNTFWEWNPDMNRETAKDKFGIVL